MGLTLWNAFAVKIRHLFKKIGIIQHDRAIGANGQRMFIALNANTGVSGGGRGLLFIGHL